MDDINRVVFNYDLSKDSVIEPVSGSVLNTELENFNTDDDKKKPSGEKFKQILDKEISK